MSNMQNWNGYSDVRVGCIPSESAEVISRLHIGRTVPPIAPIVRPDLRLESKFGTRDLPDQNRTLSRRPFHIEDFA